MNLRILAFTSSKGTACPAVTGALIAAFKRMGHELLELDFDLCGRDNEEWDETMARIRKFGPDFAISYAVVRGARFFPGNEFFLEAIGVPYVSFFFDNPFWYLQELGRERVGALREYPGYHIFCSESAYLPMLRQEGFLSAEYLPLGADAELFSPAQAAEPRYAVSFVGSLLGNPAELKKARSARWSDFPAFNRSIDDILSLAPDTQAIGRRLRDRMGMPWELHAVFGRTVCEEAVTLSRIRLLQAVAAPVHVFGNQQWEHVDGRVIYEGKIAYGKDLSGVYRETCVNLNITSPQLITAVNQRVFDTAASGAFLLTDRRQDLERIFGSTIAVYKDERDIRDKVRYFLAHDDERRQMADAARRIVRDGHTWDDRAREVISALGMTGAPRGEYAPA